MCTIEPVFSHASRVGRAHRDSRRGAYRCRRDFESADSTSCCTINTIAGTPTCGSAAYRSQRPLSISCGFVPGLGTQLCTGCTRCLRYSKTEPSPAARSPSSNWRCTCSIMLGLWGVSASHHPRSCGLALEPVLEARQGETTNQTAYRCSSYHQKRPTSIHRR